MIEISKASAARLQPGRRAITNGSPDFVAIPVKVYGGQGLTIQVDQASVRIFAMHTRFYWLPNVFSLAIMLGMGVWWARPTPYLYDHTAVLVGLAVATAFLFPILYRSYLIPRAYPVSGMLGRVVRLSKVDDAAAVQWQAANAGEAMRLKPDASMQAALLRHLPPVVLVVVIAILGRSLL